MKKYLSEQEKIGLAYSYVTDQTSIPFKSWVTGFFENWNPLETEKSYGYDSYWAYVEALATETFYDNPHIEIGYSLMTLDEYYDCYNRIKNDKEYNCVAENKKNVKEVEEIFKNYQVFLDREF